MPIVRTYACEDCNHRIEVMLAADQWAQDPPHCPICASRPMGQEFKPVAIGGSAQGRAAELAQQIAREDYGVADMTMDNRDGGVGKVRYRDQTPNLPVSNWNANQEILEGAISMGRESRLKYGNGLDVLQSTLRSGAQPDLIELSKRRSIRVF
jgi:hypothetical protein